MEQRIDAKGLACPKPVILAKKAMDACGRNGGAYLSCEDSESLEDLKKLDGEGVEILTCGTCLNHYGITEKLAVGRVTNMYEIVEKQADAGKIIRP